MIIDQFQITLAKCRALCTCILTLQCRECQKPAAQWFRDEQPNNFNLFSGGGAGPTRPQVVFQQVVWKLLISLIFYKSRFILFFKSVFSYKNFIKFALKIVNLSCRSISVQLIHFTFLARRSRSTNGCLAWTRALRCQYKEFHKNITNISWIISSTS